MGRTEWHQLIDNGNFSGFINTSRFLFRESDRQSLFLYLIIQLSGQCLCKNKSIHLYFISLCRYAIPCIIRILHLLSPVSYFSFPHFSNLHIKLKKINYMKLKTFHSTSQIKILNHLTYLRIHWQLSSCTNNIMQIIL